jgi:hypothetical protein
MLLQRPNGFLISFDQYSESVRLLSRICIIGLRIRIWIRIQSLPIQGQLLICTIF